MNQFDVIVCGGGVAGVCAAIAAAREGASVLILERNGCLGGTWTAGLVTWLIDVSNKEGYIVNEMMERLQKMDRGHFGRGGNFLCEPEAMKLLLDIMCAEVRITVRLYTYVSEVMKDGSMLTAVQTVSKSGAEIFYGKYFIDATGDGDVCAMCRSQFHKGNVQGHMQPMTMFALIDGPDYSDMVDFDNFLEYNGGVTPKERLKNEILRAGIKSSQQEPGMYHLFHDIYLLTVNQEYGRDGTNADDLTAATISARVEINKIVDGLRSLGGIWSNVRLVSTAQTIGVREGRRILGKYTVTIDDLNSNRHFEDSICSVSFGVDIHALTEDNEKGYDEESDDGVVRDYQIPMRAAMCDGTDNLFMAGRCISGDFYAHASYRVTGNSSVIGENVGKYAAKMAIDKW